jgi:hypothetical protein
VLHLLRLNLVIYFAALCASCGALLYAGMPVLRSVALAAMVAGLLQLATLAIIFFAWKWIPGFPSLVFPNIAGRWQGTIRFIREGQVAETAASLDVEQNLNVVSLVLETDSAESETIVVYPRRLSNGRRELLYVYETHRKEGKPPPFYRYRGTAILRIENSHCSLVGTYYTEQGGSGTVSFTRSA